MKDHGLIEVPPGGVVLPHKRKCPTCKGTGINPVWQTRVCPKCNGERVVAT